VATFFLTVKWPASVKALRPVAYNTSINLSKRHETYGNPVDFTVEILLIMQLSRGSVEGILPNVNNIINGA
jgi:hypothetical protein